MGLFDTTNIEWVKELIRNKNYQGVKKYAEQNNITMAQLINILGGTMGEDNAKERMALQNYLNNNIDEMNRLQGNTERDYANENADGEWGKMINEKFFSDKDDFPKMEYPEPEPAPQPNPEPEPAPQPNPEPEPAPQPNPEPEPAPQPNPEPIIPDKTDENIESPITGNSTDYILDFIKNQQKEQWAREDAIRLETQQREDTAWQRGIEDMQKAGINPNLINASPAQSGGGITQSTGMDYSLYQALLNAEASKYTADTSAATQKYNKFIDQKIAEYQGQVQKWLAEYNGDLNKTLQRYKAEFGLNAEKIIAQMEYEFKQMLQDDMQAHEINEAAKQRYWQQWQNYKSRISSMLTMGLFMM